MRGGSINQRLSVTRWIWLDSATATPRPPEKENNMNDAYLTKDLGEAAALITLGNNLSSISWKEGLAYFSFPKSDKIDKESKEYFFGSLFVDARTYYDNFKMLKRKIKEEK